MRLYELSELGEAVVEFIFTHVLGGAAIVGDIHLFRQDAHDCPEVILWALGNDRLDSLEAHFLMQGAEVSQEDLAQLVA